MLDYGCYITIGVFVFPEEIQKSKDIAISKQFKESVIQPILKVMNKYTAYLH